MELLQRAFGFCNTNCYILKFDGFEVAVDVGEGAGEWVVENAPNLQAILLTHAHFDHCFDTAFVRAKTGAKVFCPEGDMFMTQKDPFGMLNESFESDVAVKPDAVVEVCGEKFKFWHFAGHTPGCSMVELLGSGVVFSGDFLFNGSIGRFDFPFSDAGEMKKSLGRVLEFGENWTLYSGHGTQTTLFAEFENIRRWRDMI